jgi:D-alanyl-lipoteichoic acid acyltransferase DltB (MBOAT superfamily)
MGIFHLVILVVVAIVVGQIKKGRSLALLCVSALVIYWLQPPHQPFINLMYWFPTVTLIVTVFSWLLTSTPDVRSWSRNWHAAFVLIGVIVLVDMNRYFKIEEFFVTMTPRLQWVGVTILVVLVIAFLLARLREFPGVLLVVAAIGLIALLVALKMPSVLDGLFETVSAVRGKEADNSSPVSWLGFSYVSFRLLHTILDRKAGRLPSVTLAEYVNYVIFFPSFVAGPIDRLERFNRDLESAVVLDREGWVDAGGRFFLGMFKKFVIADALAWIALNDVFARDANSVGWMWILLYAYSLRIYFDFSGYTDIAIGLGRLLGVRLPENFAAPYLKPNLTQFWNSWHMTLTQWFRSYFFNPLTRVLRSSDRPLPASLIILITQITTMVLIGLWHGMTTSFVLWGLWHGFGLFVQNRWSAIVRERESSWKESIFAQMTLKYSGMFLTFNFVSLGWLFFALSTPALAWSAMLKLFGVQ